MLNQVVHAALWLSLAASGEDAATSFERLTTIDVPGRSAEIVQYCALAGLLLATNSVEGTLDILCVESLEPIRVTPLDMDAARLGVQGLNLGADPTSVAVHPRLPVAFVTLLGKETGRIVAVDLRPVSRGHILLDRSVGMHPDSVAVSPNGEWVITADEAEDDPQTPGSISVLDLRGTDMLSGDAKLPPAKPIAGLELAVGSPIGTIEPEYVAFDPQSRFAAVSCQENDAVVLIDLQDGHPRIASVVRLSKGAQPDGVSILADVPGPRGTVGCLLGVAEEGEKGRTGNAASLWWVDPNQLSQGATEMGRVDLRTLVDPARPKRRLDPEGIVMTRLNRRAFAFVAVERADCVVCLEVTRPDSPQFIAKAKTGKRPEGIIAVPHQSDLLVITGDEGSDGPGEITFLRLRPPPKRP